jgi:sulfur carrier protein ThiS adenylyltransferase
MENLTEFLQDKLGTEYVKKAASVKIGIAGCGGLGSNCANSLIRSGIINLRLVDFDTVETGNLDRQFFFTRQKGMPKAQALLKNLLEINSLAVIDIVEEKLTRNNISEIFKGCAIIIEALDREEDKAMLIECLLTEKELIVSSSGIAGYGRSDRIKVNRIKHNLIIIGDLTTGINKAKPLSPAVNIAAAKQADCVVEYLIKGYIE